MSTRVNLGEILEERGLLGYPAVEVGVAAGNYAYQILQWGVPHLYLVDLWRNVPGGYAGLGGDSDERHNEKYESAMALLAPYEGKYEVLRGFSHEMCHKIPDGSLGFCYIDASHDYPNVWRDLCCWWPKLIKGGIMAGHDWPLKGVKKAVEKFALKQQLEIHLLPVNEDDASYWLEP